MSATGVSFSSKNSSAGFGELEQSYDFLLHIAKNELSISGSDALNHLKQAVTDFKERHDVSQLSPMDSTAVEMIEQLANQRICRRTTDLCQAFGAFVTTRIHWFEDEM